MKFHTCKITYSFLRCKKKAVRYTSVWVSYWWWKLWFYIDHKWLCHMNSGSLNVCARYLRSRNTWTGRSYPVIVDFWTNLTISYTNLLMKKFHNYRYCPQWRVKDYSDKSENKEKKIYYWIVYYRNPISDKSFEMDFSFFSCFLLVDTSFGVETPYVHLIYTLSLRPWNFCLEQKPHKWHHLGDFCIKIIINVPALSVY